MHQHRCNAPCCMLVVQAGGSFDTCWQPQDRQLGGSGTYAMQGTSSLLQQQQQGGMHSTAGGQGKPDAGPPGLQSLYAALSSAAGLDAEHAPSLNHSQRHGRGQSGSFDEALARQYSLGHTSTSPELGCASLDGHTSGCTPPANSLNGSMHGGSAFAAAGLAYPCSSHHSMPAASQLSCRMQQQQRYSSSGGSGSSSVHGGSHFSALFSRLQCLQEECELSADAAKDPFQSQQHQHQQQKACQGQLHRLTSDATGQPQQVQSGTPGSASHPAGGASGSGKLRVLDLNMSHSSTPIRLSITSLDKVDGPRWVHAQAANAQSCPASPLLSRSTSAACAHALQSPNPQTNASSSMPPTHMQQAAAWQAKSGAL